MLCVVCCGVFGAGENSECLLRFGVNGSFNLNAKKISIYRLVQNLTSLLTSSVQALCKFRASSCMCNAKALHENMQSFSLHVLTEEFVSFILSASELHENVQRKSVARFHATRMLKFASFTLGNLYAFGTGTYIARDWGICHARAHHHARSNTHHQKKTTTTHNSQVLLPDHGRCSPRQALGTS